MSYDPHQPFALRPSRAERDLSAALAECVEWLLAQTLPLLDPTDPRALSARSTAPYETKGPTL